MKSAIPWILLFLISLGVGFLHGVRPQKFSRNSYFKTETLNVLATDDLLFSEELREDILKKYNISISLKITRDWDQYIGHTVSQDSVDLLLIPSHWAQSLNQQSLLFSLEDSGFFSKISPDFLKLNKNQSFLPLFWVKTSFSPEVDFAKFLEDSKRENLYLIADEDLILHHCLNWKKKNLLEKVNQKKLHFTPLSTAILITPDNGVIEVPNFQNTPNSEMTNSSFLIYGAAIPLYSAKKDLALNILRSLTSESYIENKILNSPFSSTYEHLKNESIPLNKRAQHIRNLSLQNTTILEKKIENAAHRIKTDCGFNYSP